MTMPSNFGVVVEAIQSCKAKMHNQATLEVS